MQVLYVPTICVLSKNKKKITHSTKGPVNAHLISGHSISTKHINNSKILDPLRAKKTVIRSWAIPWFRLLKPHQ